MEPALDALAEQLTGGVALEDIKLSEESKYTQLLLMEVINQTLAKAAVEDWHTQQRSTQNWYAPCQVDKWNIKIQIQKMPTFYIEM